LSLAEPYVSQAASHFADLFRYCYGFLQAFGVVHAVSFSVFACLVRNRRVRTGSLICRFQMGFWQGAYILPKWFKAAQGGGEKYFWMRVLSDR
jgi:hypothetical protein